MDRLGLVDTAFLDAEDADRHLSMAIASIAILDGPAPGREEIGTALAAKATMLPRSRQRVERARWSTARVWVDDHRFDISHHLKRVAVPTPGDRRALFDIVGDIMSRRLDRDHPLWECWVIEGLEGRRWALLTKVHHCMADGVVGSRLLDSICDHSPATGHPAAEPPAARHNGGTAVRDIVKVLRSPGSLVGQARRLAVSTVSFARGLLPVAPSSLMGPLVSQRRFASVSASLTDLHETGAHYGATVNDVALAAVTAAFRTLLLSRGVEPTANSVRALVPVSLHDAGDGEAGNRLSWMLPRLPVELADPVERLHAVHTTMSTLKGAHQADTATVATALGSLLPPGPISWGIRAATHLPQHSITTVTTNVPGPRHQLYLLGRPIVEIIPYVPIAVRLRTGIAFLSYHDRLTFGITADLDAVPEADLFAQAIADGLAELVRKAGAGAG
ncbi:WS/DGAT/MGAT family O-acyltransferase [Prauserella flavalba]|uniref:Diacylglycerol O-acyltransferase n=1 Tax=Prauserella flavalba TaxID=1477506 RepID=A0A318LQ59_9PSEU|nr:wax ester/triacylglycerol synthase family O-acyltransferase [Prauserella flavalba]PXY36541.1 hypothetical protein BA062_14250 [Prauserella flavalba]